MLGISAGLKYTQLNDFKMANDYIKYMYHDIKGLFARTQMKGDAFIQIMKRRNGLMSERFDGMTNLFVSMNSFYTNERKVSCIKRLNACYVDIDCYKLNLSKEYVLFELENEYFGTKIPVPTFIIDSGNGLYLVWKLRDEDRKALPRWNRVQNYLYETLKGLGADAACTDAARVLRVPFSINGKNKEVVKIIDFNDLTFSLFDIINEFDIKLPYSKKKKSSYPYGTATQKMRDYSMKISEIINADLPDFNSYKETWTFIKRNKKAYEKKFGKKKRNSFSRKDILRGRCKDLEKLYSMRYGSDCKRELGLFLYRHWLFECTGNSEYALNKTIELNNMMDQPFDIDYVIKRTASAENKIKKDGEVYNYSISGIIETLEITEDEMRELSFITLKKDERKSRLSRQEKNKRSYLNRLLKEGKTTKKTKIQERQDKIAELIEKGEDRVSICSILGISKATYQRDLAVLRERQEEKTSVVTNEIDNSDNNNGIEKVNEKVNNWIEKLRNYRVSFFHTLYYKSSVATARLRFSKGSAPGTLFKFQGALILDTS